MKILIGISGGVDSSYAAYKLLKEGNEVEAAVLKMHSYTEIESASEAASSLGIPLHIIDCTESFDKIVVSNFISEYKNARTPNPCIVCNSEIKFRFLLDYAIEHGFDAIATGHYARIEEFDGDIEDIPSSKVKRYAVARAKDAKKDQTYMLYRLSQDILEKLIFPLADMCKAEVRQEAAKCGLTCADRADSQEICFVPDGDYASFIEERTEPSLCGDFVDENGKVLGRHKGLIRYTVGQRKGLGISASGRIFVTKIDTVSNSITLSLTDPTYTSVIIDNVSYQAFPRLEEGIRYRFKVKLRYAAAPVDTVAEVMNDGKILLKLDTPVRAVTSGQSAVLYFGDTIALGGFICSAY